MCGAVLCWCCVGVVRFLCAGWSCLVYMKRMKLMKFSDSSESLLNEDLLREKSFSILYIG